MEIEIKSASPCGVSFDKIPNGQIFTGATRYWCGKPPHFSASMGEHGPWMKATGALIHLPDGSRWDANGELHIINYRPFNKVILEE